MAYSDKEWEIVRVFFEEGLSLAAITEREEVTIKDRSSISRKSKQEGWVKGKKATLLQKEVKAKQELGEVVDEKSTLNATELEIHNTLVSEALSRMEWLNKAALLNVQQAMNAKCANQNDYRARADTVLKAKEAVFGKTPDTVINNQQAVVLGADQFKQAAREVLDSI